MKKKIRKEWLGTRCVCSKSCKVFCRFLAEVGKYLAGLWCSWGCQNEAAVRPFTVLPQAFEATAAQAAAADFYVRSFTKEGKAGYRVTLASRLRSFLVEAAAAAAAYFSTRGERTDGWSKLSAHFLEGLWKVRCLILGFLLDTFTDICIVTQFSI